MRYLFFFTLLVLFCSNDAYSQYSGNRRNAVDRSIGDDAPRSNSRKKENQDYAGAYADYLTKELKLDGLQQAVVKTAVNDNKSALEEIYKMDISVMEKKDKIQVINDKIAAKITQVLSKEQSEKFLKLKEDAEKKAMKN